jgi:hypothetical protein
MKRTLFSFVVLLISVSVTAARTGTGDGDSSPFETAFAAGGDLRMNLCSSGVVVRGSDDNQIRVRYSGRDDGGDVKVKFKSNGNRGELEISHCPRNNFQITIDIPKVTDLRVRMFAGQLEVEQITGNKDLEIDAGQLTVAIGKAEDYGQVDGSVTTGQVDASPFNVSKGGLFRSFHQSGPGKYKLHAHVGAGQVDLN